MAQYARQTAKARLGIADIAYIAMFAAVMAICSWISVPATIPLTLQTFGVFLSVGVLGGRRGSFAVLTYLLLGTVGAPVFAGFTGGIGALMGGTGGYIIGFLFSALVMWGLEAIIGRKLWRLALSMAAGLLVCYAFGTAWFMYFYSVNTGPVGLWTALTWCVIPYIIPDAAKIVLALMLSRRLAKACRIDG